jgi:hypothetical protein
MSIIESGYNDWLKLLEQTDNMDLLQDPYNVWIEAFHVGTMLERHGIAHIVRQKMIIEDLPEDAETTISVASAKDTQRSLIAQIVSLIESKGMLEKKPH